MLNLNTLGIDVLINKSNTDTQKAYWENYDLLVWKKDDGGYTNKKGIFKDGWGFAERYSVNKHGIWQLPKRYVKYFK